MGIQYGQRPDPFGWIREIAPAGLKAPPVAQAAATTRS